MKELYARLISEISEVFQGIDESETDALVDAIVGARRVYLTGAGRSGLVARAFAMRLVHLRKRTFVVGETVVAPMRKKTDLLIAVSGSGETRSVLEIARAARGIGGVVAAVTSGRDSSLARLADLVVTVPARSAKSKKGSYLSRQIEGHHPIAPLGSLFELSAMLLFECIVHRLMERLDMDEEDMAKQHTVLE